VLGESRLARVLTELMRLLEGDGEEEARRDSVQKRYTPKKAGVGQVLA